MALCSIHRFIHVLRHHGLVSQMSFLLYLCFSNGRVTAGLGAVIRAERLID